jgi:hypothetical protein
MNEQLPARPIWADTILFSAAGFGFGSALMLLLRAVGL